MVGCRVRKEVRSADEVVVEDIHSAAQSSRFWKIMWIRIEGLGQRKPWRR